MQAWILIATLLVTGVTLVTSQTDSTVNEEEVLQQIASNCTTRLNADNELVLIVGTTEIVTLTGVTARMFNVPAGQEVTFDPSTREVSIGGVPMFENIFGYGEKLCGTTDPIPPVGPGTLFLDEDSAFFINAFGECGQQLRSISNAIANAPAPPLNITIIAEIDMGLPVSVMDVNNGQFSMTLTGADTKNIRASQQVTYSNGVLTAQGESFNNIDSFLVVDESTSGQLEGSIYYPSSPTQVIQGPGSLYVGDTTAAFIGSRSERDNINGQIVLNDFSFGSVTPGIIMTFIQSEEVIELTGETKVFTISGGSSMVSYMSTGMGAAGQVTFSTSGGRVLEFPGVEMFSIYDNNDLNILNQGDSTTVTTGGTMFTTGSSMVYISDANPAAAPFVSQMIPPPSDFPSAPFSITTNNEGVRLLMGTVGSPPNLLLETIQSITGSFVTSVLPSQSVNFNNNEIVINDFSGEPVIRIGQVNTLVANAGSVSGSFSATTPVPFVEPGTLSYSQGTAFFTTNPDLGQEISTASSTAPVPQYDFTTEEIDVNVVDGVNYTVSRVTQSVGGKPVINFEASGYYTSPDQEIIYSGDLVTIHTPESVGRGSVVYRGGQQTLTYFDTEGNNQTIDGITTFSYFSGGDVTEVTLPDTVTLQGPGKIYVSEDRMEAFFTSSDIITPEAAERIRRSPTDFVIPADQLSTIIDGTFNISTDSATVAYPGGGVIYFGPDVDGNMTYAFYINDEDELETIKQAVSTAFVFTKSVPAKDDGIIRIIFNGRVIYPYSPIEGNLAVPIGSTNSFTFNGTALIGNSLPGGLYGGITSVTAFYGISVTKFNSSEAPIDFVGPGLLLVSSDSDEAFYTTSPSTIDYLLQSIAILKQYLSSPQLDTGKGRITTKDRSATVNIGRDITAFEGAQISFVCNANGRPEPTVEFFRVSPDPDLPDNPVNISSGIIIEDNTLTLLEIEMSDAGVYKCIASNGVKPDAEASSTLRVREAVAPLLRPGWFPFHLENGQRVLFPNQNQVDVTIDLRQVEELILACRVDGRPKAEVEWFVNDMPIELTGLPHDVWEVVPGRSVLRFDLLNVYNETSSNGLLGQNIIKCEADNAAQQLTSGSVNLLGEIIDCGSEQLNGEVCSVTCGSGIIDYTYMCQKFGITTDPIDIDDVPLSIVPQIMRQRECNPKDSDGNSIICPITEFLWNVSEWSECSKTCDVGFQTRTVACQSRTTGITSNYLVNLTDVSFAPAEDAMCAMSALAGERPTERQLCNDQDCPFYQPSEFGECSVTCGGGIRERNVSCVRFENEYLDMNDKPQINVTVVNDTECDQDDRPPETTDCNEFPCFFQWRVGEFGDCGDLTNITAAQEFEFCRERSVVCLNDMDNIVDDSFCNSEIRPTSLSSCGGGRCFQGFWGAAPYGECSASCGYGVQVRELRCYSPVTLTVVPNDFCDVSKRPDNKRDCFTRNCDMCLRDESSLCPLLASNMLCNSTVAMGDSGLRCCVSCMGMVGGD